MVDASGGKIAKFVSQWIKNCQSTGLMKCCIVAFLSVHQMCFLSRDSSQSLRPRLPNVAPETHRQEPPQSQHRQKAAPLDEPYVDQRVPVRRRIVPVTVSQQVIHQ